MFDLDFIIRRVFFSLGFYFIESQGKDNFTLLYKYSLYCKKKLTIIRYTLKQKVFLRQCHLSKSDKVN